jgi:hypothetical protein
VTAAVRSALVVLVTLVAVVLAATGSSAAWALWTTSQTTWSSAVNGKPSAEITGTGGLTTTFTGPGTTATAPITLRNAGNLAGSTSTTVTVVDGSSAALAQTVRVDAWPVATTDSCTAAAAVGTGGVSGTWASLPSLTTALAAGASTVWCVRSTMTADAPTPATANVRIALTTATGSWVSPVVTGGFYLNSRTASTTATLTCTSAPNDDNYVELSWDDPYRDAATQYRAFVGSTGVGDPQYGDWHRITIAPEQLPSGATGTLTVTVRALDAGGQPTDTVAGTGQITRYDKTSGSPAVRCGA